MRASAFIAIATLVFSHAAYADCSLYTTVNGVDDSKPIGQINAEGSVETYAASSGGYLLTAQIDVSRATMKTVLLHPNGATSSATMNGGVHSIDHLNGSGGSDGNDTYKVICAVPAF